MSDDRSRAERPEEGAMRPSSEEEGERPRSPFRVRDKRIRHDAEDADAEANDADAPDAGEPVQGEIVDEGDEPEADAAGGDEDLLGQLREAKRVADERLDQAKRLKADLENYRRRAIREQTEVVERASQRLVERLLPVLDDFERAIDAARDAEGAEGLVKGVELVFRSLNDALREEGLERVDAVGQVFDPHDHEAVSSQPGDVEEPTVAEVVRPGYKLKDRTVRPAMVHVTMPAEEPASEERGEEGE